MHVKSTKYYVLADSTGLITAIGKSGKIRSKLRAPAEIKQMLNIQSVLVIVHADGVAFANIMEGTIQ